jgi:hypothetical protein
MKPSGLTALFVAFSALAFAQAIPERSLVFVFGPIADEPGKLAAHAALGTAQRWLKIAGATAEIRRPGPGDAQQLSQYMQSKDVELALLDAARTGRENDLMAFLNALDKATYALARRPGKRLLIAILESPSLSTAQSMKGGAAEADSRLRQTIDFCRSNSVNVIVLDPSPPAEKDLGPALEALATATGGALVRDPKALDTNVIMVVPEEKAPVQVPVAPAAPKGLPVYTRLIRTYPMRVLPGSDLGPMSGLLLVESPLNSLEFQTDDKTSTYLARARVTQIVRDAAGKAVWQQKKEVTLKGARRKLETRRAGNLYYMRELKLPAGQYTIEATVEDLIAGKSGIISQPLRASDSLPGFAVSDAVFVKKLDESVDKFEADQPLGYDGTAMAPMLDPVFHANQSFDLQLYFIIYPDMRGAKPEISLEILRDGQAVGRSQLLFKDEIRNTAREGDTMDTKTKGEQKHEFPYLATILSTSFDAGAYEAQVTIRQGRQTITRVVPFRVLSAK